MLGFSQILWVCCAASDTMACDTFDFSFGAELFLVLSVLLICDLNLNLLLAFSIPLNTFHSLVNRLVVTSLIHLTPSVWAIHCSDIYNCTVKQIFF